MDIGKGRRVEILTQECVEGKERRVSCQVVSSKDAFALGVYVIASILFSLYPET